MRPSLLSWKLTSSNFASSSYIEQPPSTTASPTLCTNTVKYQMFIKDNLHSLRGWFPYKSKIHLLILATCIPYPKENKWTIIKMSNINDGIFSNPTSCRVWNRLSLTCLALRSNITITLRSSLYSEYECLISFKYQVEAIWNPLSTQLRL